MQILNKKLLVDVGKVPASKFDSKMQQGSFDLVGEQLEEFKQTHGASQLQSMSAQRFSLNVTPFCLPDVRVQLEGDAWLLGLPMSAADGPDLASKMAGLHSLTGEAFVARCKSLGFIVKQDAGALVAVPCGHVVACLCTHGCQVLRWSTLCAADKATVKRDLSTMLHAHSFLSGTDYKVLHDAIVL